MFRAKGLGVANARNRHLCRPNNSSSDKRNKKDQLARSVPVSSTIRTRATMVRIISCANGKPLQRARLSVYEVLSSPEVHPALRFAF